MSGRQSIICFKKYLTAKRNAVHLNTETEKLGKQLNEEEKRKLDGLTFD